MLVPFQLKSLLGGLNMQRHGLHFAALVVFAHYLHACPQVAFLSFHVVELEHEDFLVLDSLLTV